MAQTHRDQDKGTRLTQTFRPRQDVFGRLSIGIPVVPERGSSRLANTGPRMMRPQPAIGDSQVEVSLNTGWRAASSKNASTGSVSFASKNGAVTRALLT